jgi:hypothetical protein
LDGRDGGPGKRFQAVQDLLAGTDEAVRLLDVFDASEFLDVGPGDEAALLAGDDDHGARGVPGQRLQ